MRIDTGRGHVDGTNTELVWCDTERTRVRLWLKGVSCSNEVWVWAMVDGDGGDMDDVG